MAEKCCQTVYGDGFARRGYQCRNNAKVERNGEHYCGTHDPVRVAEKRAEANRKWREEYDAQGTAHKRSQRLQEARDGVVAASKALAARVRFEPYSADPPELSKEAQVALFEVWAAVERLKEAEKANG